MTRKTWFLAACLAAALAAGAALYWRYQSAARLPDGIVSSNGRIEAEQINIATRLPGRIIEINADEGDIVDAGQVVARMDPAELNAQIRQAQARIRGAGQAKTEAESSFARVESELQLAESEMKRVEQLHERGFATTEKLDQRRNALRAAEAARDGSRAAIDQASEAVTSAREELARLNTVLDDTILKAPRRGRIQYRLAEPGEVLGAGGSVLTLLDIGNVTMTIFLPAAEAGVLAVGSDARIVLDPIPQYVIPAKVSFVAAEAQFTPKAVETADERAKLMFRVKLRIDPALLKKHEAHVKTGIRGLAFVRLPDAPEWPENLLIKLPE